MSSNAKAPWDVAHESGAVPIDVTDAQQVCDAKGQACERLVTIAYDTPGGSAGGYLGCTQDVPLAPEAWAPLIGARVHVEARKGIGPNGRATTPVRWSRPW
jgi:hypothetical protein